MLHHHYSAEKSSQQCDPTRKKREKECIHSGQFMVSDFEAEEPDDEVATGIPIPEVPEGTATQNQYPNRSTSRDGESSNLSNEKHCQQVALIDNSLSKLFQCMSIAYRQKLTSPKWNRFRGIRLRWKDKIRLNNVIWRCWHLQFIKRENTLVCQFASPLDVDIHNKPEAIVLEGKYWKRKLAAVTAEYKRWRLFYRNHVLGHSAKDEILNDLDLLTWTSDGTEGDGHMMVDEDYMGLMSDTLFSTIANQPFMFPDCRELAKAGLADLIQPSLGPLQPNLQDTYSPSFESLQEVMTGKLPSVPEEQEQILWNYTSTNSLPPFTYQSRNMCRPIEQTTEQLLNNSMFVPDALLPESAHFERSDLLHTQNYFNPSVKSQSKLYKTCQDFPQAFTYVQPEFCYNPSNTDIFTDTRSLSVPLIGQTLLGQNYSQASGENKFCIGTSQDFIKTDPSPIPVQTCEGSVIGSDPRTKFKQRQYLSDSELHKRNPSVVANTSNRSTLLTQLLTTNNTKLAFQNSKLYKGECSNSNIASVLPVQPLGIQDAIKRGSKKKSIKKHSSQSKSGSKVDSIRTPSFSHQMCFEPTSSNCGNTLLNCQKKVDHIHAEQKRRYNIKNGFDMIHLLIPQLNENPNIKLSKAAMLQKGADYIRQLQLERRQLNEEIVGLQQQIEMLNTSISNCHALLPATGAPIVRKSEMQLQEMYTAYVRERCKESWKFWIFSLLFKPLLISFNHFVANTSLDDLYRSTILWVEQHCSLVDLRAGALNSLRYLCTKTDILSKPENLPEEARQIVFTNENENTHNVYTRF